MIALQNFGVDAFFLPGSRAKLFALYYEPSAHPLKGSILYIHPFAEEMNKSRRMAALQARDFADMGFAVLLVDLFGCGDSEGEFEEATWAGWLNDIEVAAEWLTTRTGIAPHLWGLRLGASLALEFSLKNTCPPALLLWQPVLQGENFLTQFLRLRVANAMLSDKSDKKGTQELKKMLMAGHLVEVAGYGLSHALSAGIAQISLADLSPPLCAIFWIEVIADSQREIGPAANKVREAWQAKNSKLQFATAECEAFWNTPEITECPALILATRQFFARSQD